ncbi:MAG: transketolase [Bacteroidetes Order II. Incertae sedis bacterium]|nr:transketolase [Bacteroidetes Order II. bacterium]
MRRTCLNCVYNLAQRDERVVFVGSDLGPGVLDDMKQHMPDRWFMEGVAEQHVVGMAAGLAMEGFIPYVNTIATFLSRRCYEQIVLDLCLHRLPVRLIANGGGVVYAPLGPTHLATEDIAILRCVPNMTIVAPCDADEMTRFMSASLDWPDPIYIRLAKGGDEIISREEDGFMIGKAIMLRKPGEVLFVSTGIMSQRALAAAKILAEQGTPAGVLHMHTIKPLDRLALLKAAAGVKLIVTAEEHVLAGGLGSLVLETLNDVDLRGEPRVIRMGLPDAFAPEYGSQDSLLHSWRLDSDAMVARVHEALPRI